MKKLVYNIRSGIKCRDSWQCPKLTVLVLLASCGWTLIRASPARAQAEIEADPVAYGLHGYSTHVGKVFAEKHRFQLGAFGYEIPKFYGGNDRFSRRGNGLTLKYDRFLGDRTEGLFMGVELNFTRTRYTLDATHQETYRNDFTIGPRIGYRFELGSHLYVTPWFSCGYVFNPGLPVVLGNQTFERSSFGFFPTVHIGWRF